MEGERILCDLCPRRCLIEPGATGFCGSRRNLGGELMALNYGKVAVSAVDPIERNPIFHFHPGTKVLSLGTFGCNLDCDNCQSSALARSGEEAPHFFLSAQEAAAQAEEKGVDGVAFTYNEPTVWIEYVMDAGRELRRRGLSTIVNTNGFVEAWAAEDLYDHVDAANIYVKGFSEQFYRSSCGGHLHDVLETCAIAQDADTHVELTYLSIPGRNDSPREVGRFCRWVAEEMGEETPVHFSPSRPSYRLMDVPEQSMDRMLGAMGVAREEGLRYAYLAGAIGSAHRNTFCPECGELLVERGSVQPADPMIVMEERVSRLCPTFEQVKLHFDGRKCPKCGETIPFVLKH